MSSCKVYYFLLRIPGFRGSYAGFYTGYYLDRIFVVPLGTSKLSARSVLTLRRLMSYIYIYIYIYIYMEHPFLMFLDHTQRRSTVGRAPLDE